jgi:WD40 repeat protein
MTFRDLIQRIWSVRIWIVIALAIVAGLAVEYGVNSTAHRPDPHGTAIVAMAVSKAGDLIASVDARGELRFTDLSGRAVPRQGQAIQPRRLGALHPILDSNFATIDMAGNASLFSGATPAGQYQAPSPGTYLASAVNANDLIAIAIVRTAPQQQQQQQQVQPATPEYFVDFQNQGELSLPARPTVLAPYIGRPTRALFPNSSTSQPFLVGFADGRVGIITMQGSGPQLGLEPPGSSEEAPRPIQHITSSEDGDIVSVDTAGRVRFWQIEQKSESLTAKELPSASVAMEVNSRSNIMSWAEFSRDGTRVLAGGADGTADLWDAEGKWLTEFAGHGGLVSSASFSPDGTHVATTSIDKTARLWDIGGKELAVLQHDGPVRSAVFSSDNGSLLTASEDSTARLWDAQGNTLVVFKGHQGIVRSAVFSPDDSRVLTASDDGTARLWDMDGNTLAVLKHDGVVRSARFSPDGSRIITASEDRTARIWEAPTGRLLLTLKGHDRLLTNADYSPDGPLVVTTSEDNSARLWDAVTGAGLGAFQGAPDIILTFAVLSQGAQVATVSRRGTLDLWDMTDGTLLRRVRGGGGQDVGVVSFDGTKALMLTTRETARVWRLDHIDNNLCRDCAGAWFLGRNLILMGGNGRGMVVDAESGLITDDQTFAENIAFAQADMAGPALALNMTNGEIGWLASERVKPVSLGVHADAVSAVAKLPGGRVALGFLDGAIEIVDPDRQSWVMAFDIWPETREIGLEAIQWVKGLWPQQAPVRDDPPPETGASKS